MKKTILLIGFIGLLIGCTQFQVKDCGTDLDCFNQSMMNGEKAKVKYTEETLVPPNFTLYGADTFYTTKNTEAEIINCDETFCKVNLTNIEFRSAAEWSEYDGSMKTEIWEKTECSFLRVEEIGNTKGCKKIK
ncbi:hypothetical protein KKG83_03370 [Candidatus Micrarchaeota archaeon]|nr:hypothetical protein [Candidatus Micrarchaeota archaeon]MBU2476485.1 hypothetical protein [Candidatus Micrarchaeota archaeon]